MLEQYFQALSLSIPKKFSSLYNACTQIILDRYIFVKVAHMQDHASY